MNWLFFTNQTRQKSSRRLAMKLRIRVKRRTKEERTTKMQNWQETIKTKHNTDEIRYALDYVYDHFYCVNCKYSRTHELTYSLALTRNRNRNANSMLVDDSKFCALYGWYASLSLFHFCCYCYLIKFDFVSCPILDFFSFSVSRAR